MRTLFVALLIAVALSACNTAAPSPAPTTLGEPSPTAAGATNHASEPAMTITPEPTPLDTGSAGTPPCDPADLKASHGLVEDAGGARLTEVVLVSVTTCSVDGFPAFGLRDGAGAAVIEVPSAGPGATDLVGGVAYTSQVSLANWCAPEPAFPIALEIVIEDGRLPVTGGSFPEEDNLPACDGDGPPILEGSAWLPTP